MPSHPVGLSERMSEPPASVKKGLPITSFLPGTGEVYQGNLNKGIRTCSRRSVLRPFDTRQHIFFLDGPMFVYGFRSYYEGSEVQIFFEDSVQK